MRAPTPAITTPAHRRTRDQFIAALALPAAIFFSSWSAAAEDETCAVHGQFTYVEQETSDFNAPYRGPNSLSPDIGAETTDATLVPGSEIVARSRSMAQRRTRPGIRTRRHVGRRRVSRAAKPIKWEGISPTFGCSALFVRQTFDLRGEPRDGRGGGQPVARHAERRSRGHHARQIQCRRYFRHQSICPRSARAIF